MDNIYIKYCAETVLGWHRKEFSLEEIEKGEPLNWLASLNFFSSNPIEKLMYIGLDDKTGQKIYEGDILVCSDGKYREVVFIANGFMAANEDGITHILYSDVVIGNTLQISLSDYIEQYKL